MYELADSVIRLHNSKYQTGNLEAHKFASELTNCTQWLNESLQCLKMEQDQSFEGYIRGAAESLLQQTNDFVAFLLEDNNKV